MLIWTILSIVQTIALFGGVCCIVELIGILYNRRQIMLICEGLNMFGIPVEEWDDILIKNGFWLE